MLTFFAIFSFLSSFLGITYGAYYDIPGIQPQEKKNSCIHKTVSCSTKSCSSILSGISHLGDHFCLYGAIDGSSKTYYLKCLRGKSFSQAAKTEVMTLAFPEGDLCDLSLDKFDAKIFKDIRLFHVHAGQLKQIETIKKCIELAKKGGALISFDLGDEVFVRRHKEEILNLLPAHIDILFGSEKEILELTQLPPQKACDYLATLCDVVVITMGYSGSWVKTGKTKFYTPSLKTNQIVHAGVGDDFIAGFLHAFLNKAPLPECSWLASFVASKGLEIDQKEKGPSYWHDISKQVHQDPALCFCKKQ